MKTDVKDYYASIDHTVLLDRLTADIEVIGPIERGFDFPGYHFSRGSLRVAEKTVGNAHATWHRLYEQQRFDPERDQRPGDYVRRWRN